MLSYLALYAWPLCNLGSLSTNCLHLSYVSHIITILILHMCQHIKVSAESHLQHVVLQAVTALGYVTPESAHTRVAVAGPLLRLSLFRHSLYLKALLQKRDSAEYFTDCSTSGNKMWSKSFGGHFHARKWNHCDVLKAVQLLRCAWVMHIVAFNVVYDICVVKCYTMSLTNHHLSYVRQREVYINCYSS